MSEEEEVASASLDSDSAEIATTALPGTSQTLVAAREKLGFSQKEVADKLFLTTTYIRYIDDGDFDLLPKKAFVKGYLRSYARVVELSGDDVVAMFNAELEAGDPTFEMKGVTDENVGTGSITGPVMQTGIVALLVFVVVVGLIWYVVAAPEEKPAVVVTQPSVAASESNQMSDSQNEPVEDFGFVLGAGDAAGSDSQAEEVQADETPLEEKQAELTPSELDEAVIDGSIEASIEASIEQSTEQVAEQLVEQAAAAEIAEVSIERTSTGPRSFIKVDAGGFDQLELTFPDECWVEIEDSARGLIYSDLSKASEVLTVYGTAPFKLLLGKATGVEMLYNGRPFDLGPFTGQDSTAKVTVAE